MEKLKRLLDRKGFLLDKNVYGRHSRAAVQPGFDPLLRDGYDRARVLQALSEKDDTVPGVAARLSMEEWRTFDYIKDLLKRNMLKSRVLRIDTGVQEE